MSVTWDEMGAALLKYGGFPVSNNNVNSMVCWFVSESSKAEWNPTDTTEEMPGSTDYNEAGVKNYPSIQTGLEAWKRTINNGRYTQIIRCLSESAPPALTCSAIENSPWGSKPSSTIVAEVLTHWTTYASVIVAGSEDTAPLPPAPTVTPAPLPVPSLPIDTTPSSDPTDFYLEAYMIADPEFAVRWLYWTVLKRIPDSEGFTTNVEYLQNGGTLNQLMTNMQDSEEGTAIINSGRV